MIPLENTGLFRFVEIIPQGHTFATRSIDEGFDPKTLSEVLGHSNVKTTLQLYVHPSMSQKRRLVEGVSGFLPAAI